MFDLGPATQDMARLVSGVRDDQLDGPTPCTRWTVGDLLAHVHQFTSVFVDTARKQAPDPPQTLVDDWRTAIPDRLDALAAAWREESAWEGRVSAGGVEMAAADNAVVAIEELTTHAWDLSRATGQDFDVDDARLDEVDRFFTLFDPDAGAEGPFGPHAPVPEHPTRFQRTLSRTGRDPLWTP